MNKDFLKFYKLKNIILLHSEYISIHQISQQDYENLSINYSFFESLFGSILIASTSVGVACAAFIRSKEQGLGYLERKFRYARFNHKNDNVQNSSLPFFNSKREKFKPIKLHLKATDFQLKVWQKLLQIPFGELWSYSDVAKSISKPKAVRAVGTAVKENPIAFLIPCHRVIKSSGDFGQYRWGSILKRNIIEWEKHQMLMPGFNLR